MAYFEKHIQIKTTDEAYALLRMLHAEGFDYAETARLFFELPDDLEVDDDGYSYRVEPLSALPGIKTMIGTWYIRLENGWDRSGEVLVRLAVRLDEKPTEASKICKQYETLDAEIEHYWSDYEQLRHYRETQNIKDYFELDAGRNIEEHVQSLCDQQRQLMYFTEEA